MIPMTAVSVDYEGWGFYGVHPIPKAKLAKLMPMDQMLNMTHPTYAHHYTYIVKNPEKFKWLPRGYQFRMVLANLVDVEFNCFVCDIDNDGHRKWTPYEIDKIIAGDIRPDILPGEGYNFTSSGYHIYQILSKPILSPSEYDGCHNAWLMEKIRRGIPIDIKARGWWRLWKVPSYTRPDGTVFTPYAKDFSTMKPIEWNLSRTCSGDDVKGKQAKTKAKRHFVPKNLNYIQDLPQEYRPMADRVCEAIRGDPEEISWHNFHIDFAGYLCQHQKIPYELVPAICLYVAQRTADSKPWDRYNCGKTTVAKYERGDYVRQKINDRVIAAIEGKNLIDARKSLEEARETIRKLGLGVTILRAPCGTGKTRMIIEESIDRASKKLKTFIVVDKNSLAIQIQNDIADLGYKAMRMYGPLSVRDHNGKTVCQMAEVAKGIADGGLSVRQNLCKKNCPFSQGCPAKEEDYGDRDAKIVIAVHDLLPTIVGMAGPKDLVVIDEIPSIIEYIDVMETANAILPHFAGVAYKDTMSSVIAWLHLAIEAKSATMGIPNSLEDKVKLIEQSVPSLSESFMSDIRDNIEVANAVGKASRFLSVLHRIIKHGDHYEMKYTDDEPTQILLFNRRLVQALKRKGTTLLMAADAHNYIKSVERIVGGKPAFMEIKTADGGPMIRRHLRSDAKKTDFVIGKTVHISNKLVSLWKDLIGHIVINKNLRKIGIISNRVLAYHIYKAFLRADFKGIVVRNLEYDNEKTNDDAVLHILCVLSDSLDKLFKKMPEKSVLFGNYYGMRGLNHMMDCDATITFGDAWPNIGCLKDQMRLEGTYTEEEFNARIESVNAAELDQAHGRLRTPHRKVLGYQYHLGMVRPEGSGWQNCEFVNLERHARIPELEAIEIISNGINKAGTARKLAEIIGSSESNVSRWVSGKRKPDEAFLMAVRDFVDS